MIHLYLLLKIDIPVVFNDNIICINIPIQHTTLDFTTYRWMYKNTPTTHDSRFHDMSVDV